MDPIRNPYAPGAGQRPPELAGRGEQLAHFDVVLERVARSRPERSLILTGLRGVGKTVLLNALRGQAVRARWGTGKLESRPDQTLRRPLGAALHMAVRELGHPDTDQILGEIRAFIERDAKPGAKLAERWNPGIRVPAVKGRADSGDIEIDLVELFTDLGGLAADMGVGIGVFIDEMQDLGPDDVSALCAACHEISQQRLPLIVIGAGLPHLPALLSASKSYSERLFSYQNIDRLDRAEADKALQVPAQDEDADWGPDALAAMYEATGGYPYFIQAYGKAVWDVAASSPISADDVRVGTPEAEGELVAGHMTEYSSMKFGWYYLSEYVNMLNVSAVATTMFLGGWHAPWPLSQVEFLASGWMGMVWFFLKMWFFMFLLIWTRATLLRFRYDQFMTLGWKWLMPIALAWLVMVALVRGLTQFVTVSAPVLYGSVAVVFLIALVVIWVTDPGEEPAHDPADEEYTGFADGFPVPPLPGQSPVASPRAARAAAAAAGGTSPASPHEEGSDE